MAENKKKLQLRKNQALVLIKQNRIMEARNELLALSSMLPKDKVIWLELGRITVNLGQHSEAINFLEKAVLLAPKSAEAFFLLGVATQSSGDTINAISFFMKGMQVAPKNIEFSIRLGYAYTGIDNNKAAHFFKKALARQSDNTAAIAGLAYIHTYNSDTESAYKILSPLLKKQPLNLQIAAAYADICRPLQQCQKAIELLNSALTGKHTITDQCRGRFALGKLYDQQEEYELAFKHYRLANSITDRQYTPAQDRLFFDGMISSMNNDFFSRTPQAQNQENHKQIVFIVGMPRSGSTLIEQILATGESVYAAGELSKIATIAASLPTEVDDPAGYPSCLEKINLQVVNRLARSYLEYVSEISPDNSELIIDKMPDNFRFLGFIQLLFPNAKIIHCKRNPMDTCLSCYFQNFEGGHSYSHDLENLGIYYRLYEKLMTHWKSTLKLPVLDIEYETLVQKPHEVSKTLLEFCGLEWSADCLEYFKNKNSIVTASFDQVRQPIYQRSIARWKNYESHLQPLQQALTAYRP